MNTAVKKNIVVCERFATEALIELKKQAQFNVSTNVEADLAHAHALVIRSKFKITEELLEKCPHLEAIVTCTSGYDHIDLKATQKRNITVMYTPDANVVSTAELTWALILGARRQTHLAHKEIRAGHWSRDQFMSQELSGQTIGIVGIGRIGTRVAQIAKAFEMQVLAFDPYQTNEQFLKAGAERVSYEELLKQSDIISFHVPATFETKNMFSRSQIEYVSPEITIINASRGSVIHEDDLADALNEGKIKFAALDVFAKEPLGRESKLLKNTRTLLTPHLGAYTQQAFLKASLEGSRRLIEHFLHNKSLNTLPLQNDWGSLSFAERN